ncbi:MAG: hypothetical protein ACRDIU_00050, partial [Actinomycetota bacterium]
MFLVYLVNRYGVNLPFSDQWAFVDFIRRSRASGLPISDYFSQHGEQRMAFPRMIMMALARLTKWNIRAELFVNLMLAAAIFTVLVLLVLRTLKGAPAPALAAIPALSVMVFSVVQWEDWFWGWQISWFLPLLAMVFAVGVLCLWPDGRAGWPAVVMGGAAAAVGQFSLLSATMIWVVCIPVILLRKGLRNYLWLWVPVGIISTAVYLNGYATPRAFEGHHVPVSVLWERPHDAAAYILYLLGRPVLDERPRYLAGVLLLAAFTGLAAYVVSFRREALARAAPWLSIGAYAAGGSVLTMLGRMGLGLQFAGSSRYTTLGILLVVASLGLATVVLVENGRAWIVAFLWAGAAFLFVADTPSELELTRAWHNEKVM